MSGLAEAIVGSMLEKRPQLERAECMSCGRAVDAVKAAKMGGRHRFCSDRCLEYYDAGWRADLVDHKTFMGYGAKTNFVLHRNASGRSKTEAQKHRRKAEKKAAFAESWKRYKAKQGIADSQKDA
jgi:endogenous inhibitor of DNA gyrase (YacG/DUF329 family)